MNTTNILDYFSALEDPRQYWKVLYLLPEILLAVLCVVMAGADYFVEIERWGKRKLEQPLKTFLYLFRSSHCCPTVTRRTRELGYRKSLALGNGCCFPRRFNASSNPKWPRKHGHHPPYSSQYHQADIRQSQLESAKKNSGLGR